MARGSCGLEHGARRRDRKGWVTARCPAGHPQAPPGPAGPPLPGVQGRCPRSPACHIRALVLPSLCAPTGSTAGFRGVTWFGAGELPALGVLESVGVGWRWSLGRGSCGVAVLVGSWLPCGWRWLWAPLQHGGSQWGAAFLEGISWGTVPVLPACLGVCTCFCRGLCALFGVTVGWWLRQLCPTPAVSPP